MTTAGTRKSQRREVGESAGDRVMRNVWRETTIGELGRVVTGKTPPTGRQELFGEDYPFITPTDIDGPCHTVRTERFLSEEGREFQESLLLPTGTVCFVCIGATIGKMCLTTRPSFTNQQVNSVIADEKHHDPRFVYYLLRNEANSIKSIAGGAATPIVNKSAFSGFPVRVPLLEAERKIAGILSAYDDLIENNTRRIKILDEMAQTLYREWFVHFRFPGHEKVKMVDSPLGKIPEGWVVKNLGEVCQIVMGQSPKSEFYNETGEGLPFHQGVTDFGERFPTDRVYCTVLNRIAEAGGILFSVRAPVGRINITNKKIVIGRGLCAIRSSTGNQAFAFQQLKDKFKEEDLMGGGTIFKSVTKDDVYGIKFLLSIERCIIQFEQIVNSMFSEISNLTVKDANLRSTRDLLLPKLISGEVDVSILDVETGATKP
jgi:type I restriction enzyme, S subunit